MTGRSPLLTLCILLGLWAGVAIWVMAGAPTSEHVPLTYVTGQAGQGKSGRSQAGPGLKIRMDLLAIARRQAQEAFVLPKNIFASLPSEKIRTPARVGRRVSAPAPSSPAGPAVAAPAAPPPPSPEELAAQAARQELAQFRYLGYLNRAGKEQAFLARGTELYIVRSGEMIEQKMRVKAITETGVILQDPRTQMERAVPLAEGR